MSLEIVWTVAGEEALIGFIDPIASIRRLEELLRALGDASQDDIVLTLSANLGVGDTIDGGPAPINEAVVRLIASREWVVRSLGRVRNPQNS
jgi:hypothetical protein